MRPHPLSKNVLHIPIVDMSYERTGQSMRTALFSRVEFADFCEMCSGMKDRITKFLTYPEGPGEH